MPLSIGHVLENRYRTVILLGQGGMGAVYKAWDLNLNRPCAVKENLDTSAEAQRQFQREAQMLSSLRHPNLPVVTDHFFVPGSGQYLVMDFVEGEDLDQMLNRAGRLDQRQALNWMGQVCDALDHLHRQSPAIIHRDVKPANVKITPQGKAVLVDFGIAKVYDPTLRTTVGARAVAPGYSPPEQYGRGRTDARTDVYAVGATLYTLLTGQEPPEAVELVAGSAALVPPQQANPGISPHVAAAILRAMDIRRTNRYPSAGAFRAALSPLQSRGSGHPQQVGQPMQAISPPAAVRVPNWVLPAAAGLLLVIVAVILLPRLVGGGGVTPAPAAMTTRAAPATVSSGTTAAPAGPPSTSPATVSGVTTAAPAGPPTTPISTLASMPAAFAGLAPPVEALANEAGVWSQFTNGNRVYDLLFDNGLLWTATSGGVVVWDPATGQALNYTTLDGLGSNAVSAVERGPDGALWFGTWCCGVSRYDPATGDWRTFSTGDGLADDFVLAVAAGPDGALWFGTPGGVSRYDPATGDWRTFSTGDGLADDDVRAVAAGPDGALWFGTTAGVSRYDLAMDDWRTFGAGDGRLAHL